MAVSAIPQFDHTIALPYSLTIITSGAQAATSEASSDVQLSQSVISGRQLTFTVSTGLHATHSVITKNNLEVD